MQKTARQKFKIGNRVKHGSAFKGTVKGYIKGQRYRVRVLVDGDSKATLWNAAYWDAVPVKIDATAFIADADIQRPPSKFTFEGTDANTCVLERTGEQLLHSDGSIPKLSDKALEVENILFWDLPENRFNGLCDIQKSPERPSLFRALKKWILGR